MLGSSGQIGQPGRPAGGARAAAPQSALQRIHQRVSDAAAKARCYNMLAHIMSVTPYSMLTLCMVVPLLG